MKVLLGSLVLCVGLGLGALLWWPSQADTSAAQPQVSSLSKEDSAGSSSPAGVEAPPMHEVEGEGRSGLATSEPAVPSGERLELRLLFMDDAPVGNAWVELSRGGDEKEEAPVASAFTDDEGRLFTTGFDGAARVRVEGVAVAPIELALPSARGEQVLRIPGATFVEGILRVDEVVPVEPVELGVQHSGISRAWRKARTGPGGRFRFVVTEGARVRFVLPKGLELRDDLGETSTLNVQAPASGVVLETRSLPALRGRLVNAETGEPVGGGRIVYSIGNERQSNGGGAMADDDGRFAVYLERFSWEPEVEGRLELRAADGTLATSVELAPFDSRVGTDLGDLFLGGTRRVDFIAVDSNGMPVSGAVAWVDPEFGPRSSRTDADGSGSLTGIQPTSTHFCVLGPEHAPVQVPLPTTGNDPVRIVLPRAGILQIEVDKRGASQLRGLTVALQAEGELFEWDVPGEPQSVRRAVRGAAPMSSNYVREKGEVASSTLRFRLPKSGHLQVTGLKGGHAITIQVYDSIGTRVGGDRVRLGQGETRTATIVPKRAPIDVGGSVKDATGDVPGTGKVTMTATAEERIHDWDGGVALPLGSGGIFLAETVYASRVDLLFDVGGAPTSVRNGIPVPEGGVLGLFHMSEGKGLQLSVVDTQGAPVGGGSARVLWDETPVTRLSSEEPGVWSGTNVPAVPLSLVFEIAGRTFRADLTSTAAEHRLVVPELGAARFQWELKSVPVARAFLLRIDPMGEGEEVVRGVTPGASGSVLLEGLFHGQYHLSLQAVTVEEIVTLIEGVPLQIGSTLFETTVSR